MTVLMIVAITKPVQYIERMLMEFTQEDKQDYIERVIAEIVKKHHYTLDEAKKIVQASPLRECLDECTEAQFHIAIEISAEEVLEFSTYLRDNRK